MARVVFVLLSLATMLYPAEKKRNLPKPPDLEVVEAVARRLEGQISIDGRVRNCGEKPLNKLKLFFDFMAPGRQVITTKNSEIEDGILEPGSESEFHLRLVDPVRAVEFRINAEEGSGHELRVDKNGPFPVE